MKKSHRNGRRRTNHPLLVQSVSYIDKPLSEGGPPYGINLDQTMECFSEYYDIIECKKSELTIEPRFDNEIFTIMKKKCKK